MTRARDLGDFIADGAAAELVVDTTTLVVDSTNNRVGIGTASPSQALDVVGNATITTADNTTQLTLVSTDADANSGPSLIFSRDSGSPADNDAGGKISFQFDDDAGNPTRTAAIFTTLVDASNGSEDGKIHIETMIGGAEAERFGIGPTEVVINEASVDLDFRVESDSGTHALFVQGSSGNVGINSASPGRSLVVESDNNRVVNIKHTAGANAFLTFSDTSTTDDGSVRIGAVGNDLIAFVGAAERLRVATSGQIGIGGQNYGTAGQVLSSGGASAAPTWADAGGGGSIELTASEGISAGTVVTLKSNGQSQLVGYTANATSISTETKTATSTSINYPAAAYDPDTGKVGVVYSDSASRAQAAIFTPSGYGGSFGSATQLLNDQDANNHRMMYDTTNNQFVGIHALTSDNTGKYFVLSTNGSTMTVDTANANFEGSEVTHLSMDIDQTNAKVFIAYRHSGNSNRGTIIAGTLNDGSVSWGSGHVFQTSNAAESPYVAWNSVANVVYVVFKYSSGNVLRHYVATVSGTTFTDRNIYSHGGSTSSCMAVADPANSTASNAVFHVAFYGGSSGIQMMRQSFNTSSWSGSSSTIHVLSAADPDSFSSQYAGTASLTRDALTGRLYLFTKESTAFFEITYDPVSDSYTSEKRVGASSWMVNAEQITRLDTTQDTSTGTLYNVVRDASNNLAMQTSSVSDVNTFLGVSESTVTTGNTHKVTVISGVNEAVSGLTPGSTYYLTGTGALTTTNTGIKIGKALAANKLYIDSTGD